MRTILSKFTFNIRISLLSPLVVITIIGIILAFLLAIVPLNTQFYFYYDQARDAFQAYNILHNHHIEILGPGTDIPGLFSGVFWYYLLAIPYSIGNNNPEFSGYFLLLTIFLTLPVCGYLAYELFKNRFVVVITLLLYTFSPLFQISTRWLSNPVLAIIVTPFLLLLLWRYLNRHNAKYAAIIGLFLGVLIQSDLAFTIFLIPLLLSVIFFRVKFRIVDLVLFLAGLSLGIITFIIAEIKFHFRGVHALITFLTASHSSVHSYASFPEIFVTKFINFLSLSISPFPVVVIFGLLAVLLIFGFKKSVRHTLKKYNKAQFFLLIWLCNIIFFELFNTGISGSDFVFLPSLLALILLGSLYIAVIVRNKLILVLLLLVILSGQVYLNIQWIRHTANTLTVQDGITYNLEKQILDYTYRSSDKKPFSLNTITSPLYINTTWAYLYQFYGIKKYGYMPFWDGSNQQGDLGNLPVMKQKTAIEFFIIEPSTGIPDYFIEKETAAENAKSVIIEERKFGNFIVQKRKLK